jgi:flagellin
MQIGAASYSLKSYYDDLAKSQKSMQHISSGQKVNSAADSAAAIAIIQGMYGQSNGLVQAADNTQDSINLLDTAEGAMDDSTSVIQDMRQLSVQAANGTLTDQDRSFIQLQMDQLNAQINANAANTQYNTINTNDGSLSNFVSQVGANSGDTYTTSIASVSSAALGLNTDVSTQAAAENSIQSLDDGLQQLTDERASVGASTNALQASSDNATQAASSLQSAESVLGDTDIAQEISLMSSSNVKAYASIMMLAKQMNQQKGVLSLLA